MEKLEETIAVAAGIGLAAARFFVAPFLHCASRCDASQ
jgi:hypothetical protein